MTNENEFVMERGSIRWPLVFRVIYEDIDDVFVASEVETVIIDAVSEERLPEYPFLERDNLRSLGIAAVGRYSTKNKSTKTIFTATPYKAGSSRIYVKNNEDVSLKQITQKFPEAVHSPRNRPELKQVEMDVEDVDEDREDEEYEDSFTPDEKGVPDSKEMRDISLSPRLEKLASRRPEKTGSYSFLSVASLIISILAFSLSAYIFFTI